MSVVSRILVLGEVGSGDVARFVMRGIRVLNVY